MNITLILYRYKYIIALFIYALLNISLIDNLPWGDDYPFIFDSYIKNVSSPLSFWNVNSPYFKSWPLTYSILWVLLKLFGKEYFAYRIFNIFLHIANVLVFLKVQRAYLKSNKQAKNIEFFVFFIFLFHPIALITVNWIFQIKTLLSMFFALITLYFFSKVDKKFWQSFCVVTLFFTLSLASKISAILLPFFFLTKYKALGFKRVLLVFSVNSLIAILFGLITIKGVNSHSLEKSKLKGSPLDISSPEKQVSINPKRSLSDFKPAKSSRNYSDIPLSRELKESLNSFNHQLSKDSDRSLKLLINFFTFGRYLASSIGVNSYSLVYEKNSVSLKPLRFIFYILLSFVFFLMIFKKGNTNLLLLTLLLFIPIGGTFYIPYMKMSYLSDHWFYLSLPFLICIILRSTPSTKLKYSYVTIIFIQFIFLTIKFKDSESFINHSFNLYKNPFLKEYKVRLLVEKKDYLGAYSTLKELSSSESQKKFSIEKSLYIINRNFIEDDELFNQVRKISSYYFERQDKTKLTQILEANKDLTQGLEGELLIIITSITDPNKTQSNIEKAHYIFKNQY